MPDLTPERIARLRELHEAGQPAPWYVAFNDRVYDAQGCAVRAYGTDGVELIAEARNALPDLLTAIERLRVAGASLVTAVFYDRDQRSDESAERLRWCLAAMAAELPNPDGPPSSPETGT